MEEPRRIYRSRKNRIIAGVCGGIAEYFNIDPVIVRIIFALLAIWGGVGILAYIIGLIVIPEEGDRSIAGSKSKEEFKEKVESVASDIKKTVESEKGSNRGEKFLGLVFLLVGFVLLFNTFFPWLSFGKLWPLVLIIIGVAILLSGSKKG
jgi:phage shock protein PspC (stress-responsive transcriptional regulator)